MKIKVYELGTYFNGIPPEDGEDTRAYATRLREVLTEDWGLKADVDFDAEDIEALVGLATKANPAMPRGAVVGGPPPVVTAAATTKSVSSGAAKLIAQREAEKEERKDARIYFDTNFDMHIFKGEPDGGSHKGLHHMPGVLGGASKPTVVKGEIDAKAGVYVADVSFPGKTAKASSFFPDDWSQAMVRDKIEEAVRWVWNNPTESAAQARSAGLKWVGYAKVDSGLLMIGGLGGRGDSPKEAIVTAFPAVNGRFLKL